MVQYTRLRERLHEAGLVANASQDATPQIRQITCDSRTAAPGTCFVAVRGTRADGHRYVDEAIARGAVMVVTESAAARNPGAVARVQVTNAREALAVCAAALYGNPAESLTCIGITGTNGKTTTAWLLYQTLTRLGEKSGLLGTVAYTYGGLAREASLTTPGAPELHQMLREMVQAGCRWCVMEVSSHALDQRRVHGLPFSAGVFTNLRHDHLDYHKTPAAYLKAKKRLFSGLDPGAVAILNADDAPGRTMAQHTRARKITYGQGPGADIRFRVRHDALCGLTLDLDGHVMRVRLSGAFNAYNIAAAYAAACARGLPPDQVRQALSAAPHAPGRFEPMRFSDGALAIVDYAHTPDALEKALSAVRQGAPGSTLWCLFGCGGDRDKAKRPAMGSIAERLADHVIVTSDNTRSETFASISTDIAKGMTHPQRALWIRNRREAIRHVAARVSSGDVVLIAGKGHESVQVTGRCTHRSNDRDLVLQAFAPREHIT